MTSIKASFLSFFIFAFTVNQAQVLRWHGIYPNSYSGGVTDLSGLETDHLVVTGTLPIGNPSGFDFDFGPGASPTFNEVLFNDTYIAQYGDSGQLDWYVVFDDYGSSLRQVAKSKYNGNVILTGGFNETYDADPGAGVTTLTYYNNLQNAMIMCLDSTGQFQWAKSFHGTDFAGFVPWYIEFDSYGSVYITGNMQDTVYFNSFADTIISSGYNDPLMVKFDSSGVLQWVRQLEGASSSISHGLAFINDTTFVWMGMVRSPSIDLNGDTGTYIVNTAMQQSTYLAAYHIDGSFEWGKIIAQSNNTVDIFSGFDIRFIENELLIYGRMMGDSISVGDTNYNQPLFGNLWTTGNNDQDGFVATFDSAGNLHHARSFASYEDDDIAAFNKMNGHYIVAGELFGDSIDVTPGEPGGTIFTNENINYFVVLDSAFEYLHHFALEGISLHIDIREDNFWLRYDVISNSPDLDMDLFEDTVMLNSPGSALASYHICYDLEPADSLTFFLSQDTTICAYDTISLVAYSANQEYSWVSNGQLTALNQDSISFHSNQDQQFVLMQHRPDGCRVPVDTLIVKVKAPPTLTLSNDMSVCLGDTAVLTASGDYQFLQWSGPYPFTEFDTDTTSYIPDSLSFVYCDVMDSIGCVSQDSVLVDVFDLPFISTIDSGLCFGDSIQLGLIGSAAQYQWMPGSGLSDSTILDPVFSPDTTTNYQLLAVSAQGCSNTFTASVEVWPPPFVYIMDTSYCLGDSVQLNPATTGNSFQWSPNTGISNDTLENPWFSPVSQTTYSLYVTDSNQCSEIASASISIIDSMDIEMNSLHLNGGNYEFTNQSSGNDSSAWYANGTYLNSASQFVLDVSDSLSLQMCLVIWNACYSDTSCLEFYDGYPLGNKKLSEVDFVVYPNPSQGIISIQSSMPFDLRLFDLMGNLLIEEVNQKPTAILDLSSLPSSTYHLVLFSNEGSFSQRIIKL